MLPVPTPPWVRRRYLCLYHHNVAGILVYASTIPNLHLESLAPLAVRANSYWARPARLLPAWVDLPRPVCLRYGVPQFLRNLQLRPQPNPLAPAAPATSSASA